MNNFCLFIFGVTGNLSQIKILPSLYDLFANNLLPEVSIVGIGRKAFSQSEFINYVSETLHLPNRHHTHAIDPVVWQRMSNSLTYISGNMSDKNLYDQLKLHQQKLNTFNSIFYLATYPDLYKTIFSHLKLHGLESKGWFRLLIEKPIGSDLPSSRELNQLLSKYFTDSQVFRLDHYLGKETLQNILTFRFGNGILEPLTNREYIDNIQITAAEDFGIEKRGGYYDTTGALKDVGQNHLLQMLTAITMDAPSDFTNYSITQERIRVLERLKPDPNQIIFGQYQGYKNEPFVNPDSTTDTYFSLKCELANDRFEGVPIYMRAGKKLEQTVTEISIIFKVPVNRLFSHLDKGSDPNVLIFRIQPNEGVVLRTLTKLPGNDQNLDHTYMQFCYKDFSDIPDPYERLLFDAINGDQTFFNDPPEVELQWAFIDQLSKTRGNLSVYQPGSWGPPDSFPWLTPSPIFCRL